ncbi:MAG TPA: alpha-amylase family glycosyl hydrolase [Bacillota bacterium]|nr:alpha-amylase family glycosyl hydrolase [Bacillota bacterium]
MRKLLIFGVLLSMGLLSIELSKTSEVRAEVPYVPEWAKNVVWYQITPETFRDGDLENQPTWAMQNHYFPELPKDWQVHPWGADLYALADYEQKNSESLLYNMSRRRHGGDIQGIISKLDYLKELGIGALYINPMFYSYSFHKYNAICYHHIDPYFGPDPEGDKALINKEIPDDPKTWVWTQADRLAIKLIEEAHRRKIRIIFDGPFNHVGLDCFAFQDLLKNKEKSRFVNWVTIYEWPNPEKKTPIRWQDWMGEKIYATLRKDQKEPNDYIMASTKRWMKPEIDGETHDGIDGWRLDCADFIPHEFWQDWCKFVRTINPQAYIMGEVVKPFAPYQSYLNSEEFCSVMNYPFKSLIEKYFINKSINASDF